jgi:sugar/nucleoside kinase (ribokinase family)
MKRSTRRSIDAVVAGYLGVDLTPGFPNQRRPGAAREFFRPGRLIETCGLNLSLGGAVANTGLVLQQFGQRVRLMGCVGTDALGDAAIGLLRARALADGIKRTNRAGTAYGIVLAPPGIDRIFFEDPGCNAIFSSAAIDYDTVRRARVFHFGYPPLLRRFWVDGGRELAKVFARVRRLGVATSLDLSLPDPASPAGQADWCAILARVLPEVGIFAPSVEELLYMLEPRRFGRLRGHHGGPELIDAITDDVIERLGETVLAAGVRVLLLKLGHRGAYVRTGIVAAAENTLFSRLPTSNWSHRTFWVDAAPADRWRVRNACGAGDCAVAGWLSAMLAGETIERAARCAMLAGRDNLYGVDAVAGLRGWKTMMGALQRCPHRPAIRRSPRPSPPSARSAPIVSPAVSPPS